MCFYILLYLFIYLFIRIAVLDSTAITVMPRMFPEKGNTSARQLEFRNIFVLYLINPKLQVIQPLKKIQLKVWNVFL